jgi:glucose-6-phosphate dehydrogenase-like protein
MIQNHLLQLLCLVAMDSAPTLSEGDVRDCKVGVVRAVTAIASSEVVASSKPEGRKVTGLRLFCEPSASGPPVWKLSLGRTRSVAVVRHSCASEE